MKNTEKFSAFETSGGKYSARKIPQWRMGFHELQEYLDFINSESDEAGYGYAAG